ncbi:PKD domain-containing protein [Pseudobacter ginsenosidimutans]|uniref:Gliding motility-associated-like protein n=1 Tax=Pseudobacter ginsenosidimutans TaxID=661488 RepID=A0A4Q7N617_9BACT|nr:PKD domain-containing protein [Pseudobacter ginsenosidimutans]QEC45017.1 T9SS type B sorting domain-containing protein [Pseudobacter ginsenosidimutans]RZS76511.1 gliding motility-associated-like protein [Pseudobacter ginsenosidimutans]
MSRILLLAGLLFCSFAWGQDFTNKGKEFWLGYGNHQQMYTASLPGMDIYITSDVDTKVLVEIPAMGITIGTFEVKANQITVVPELTHDAFLNQEGISNKGIHILAEHPVVVYAHIYTALATGSSLCLPVSTIGREYYSVNFTQIAQPGPTNESSYSYFFVVAIEDNTEVEIIPAATGLSGSMVAGQAYTIRLNRGQVFNYLSRTDLTGSIIRTRNSANDCKKIAAFSGSGRLGIGCGTVPSSSDNLIQQLYPKTTWGRKFLTVPSATRPGNYYRIIRPDPGTRVRVDGVLINPASFRNNLYYEFNDALPHVIEGDRPILVAQYFTNNNCGEITNNGDPEMILLNPVEQVITHATMLSMRLINDANPIHFINVLLKNQPAAINSFTLDGQFRASDFQPHPVDSRYAYAQIRVEQGTHTIACDTPFNAIAYGFSQNESYGYSAGTNLSDLHQYVTVENDHSPINIPASCRNSPFGLAMTFPYQPAMIHWIFGTELNALGIRDSLINNPVYDSTWLVDGGVRLYRYRLKREHRISRPGNYAIRIQVINPTSDGCTGEQLINFDFQVFEKPVASFSVTHNGCITDDVLIKGTSRDNGRPLTNWFWSYGDGRRSTGSADQVIRYAAAGNYNIRHAVSTDIGCTSDTAVRLLRISPPPTAAFEFRDPVCEQRSVRIASTSTSVGDRLSSWEWDLGDGQTLRAANGNPITHRYEETGSRTISLQVTTARGCRSERVSQTVMVNPLPQVNFGFPEVCIDDPLVKFSDSSSIADHSEDQFKWLWQFGDNQTSADQHPGHVYAQSGNYQVRLQVTSKDGCAANIQKRITVNGRVQAADFVLPAGALCASSELVIREASRIQSGKLSSLSIWWDYDRDPTVKTVDEDPAPGKQYAHKYDDFNNPPTRDHKIVFEVHTGEACLGTLTRTVTLKASPVVAFDGMSPVCAESPPLVPPARETLGFPGNGVFSGPGMDPQGYFHPAVAGTGTHTLGFRFQAANGCSASATQTITVNPTPTANAGPDKGILPDGVAVLDGSGTGEGIRYSWLPADQFRDPSRAQPSVSPKEDSRYTLVVSSRDGCKASDEVWVKVLPKVVVPNAFTPNGDGINETWVLLYLESYPNCTVDVFNRYGQRVFHSTGYGRAWDGRLNGSLLPAGTYYWVIDPKTGKGLLKGSVTIIR